MTDLRHLLTRWPRAWHMIGLDVCTAVVITIIYIGFGNMTPQPGEYTYDGPMWIAVVLAVGVGGPIAVRRKWPLPALACVVVCTSVATVAAMTKEPYTATVIAMYMVALAERRSWSLIALVATAVITGAAQFIGLHLNIGQNLTDTAQMVGFLSLVLTVTWVIGHGTRRLRLAEFRNAAESTSKAIVDERLRIAREMHDVVAHSLSVIAVKAGIANHVAEEHPTEAREALRVIETISRGALIEMRGMLGVLRSDTEDAELTPAPTLAEIPALAERARQAGVRVKLELTDLDGLPEGVSLAVYRIVQEALTNVVKHAAPADCRVTVAAVYGEVRVDIVDDGPGHRVLPERFSEPGHGVDGMRERVMMFAGTFEAGPRPGGGFAVRARIPYRTGETS
ncbi:sensor histidine kinase [Actinorhabdospora filicis]|uniref:sensor histidine kinase n=1 Tax=Actinorhabdospora filicis TaxID=1785913 RepID=UPI002556A9B0|nr:sensor histidine kinase [Actinorhabdospora filicis]